MKVKTRSLICRSRGSRWYFPYSIYFFRVSYRVGVGTIFKVFCCTRPWIQDLPNSERTLRVGKYEGSIYAVISIIFVDTLFLIPIITIAITHNFTHRSTKLYFYELFSLKKSFSLAPKETRTKVVIRM